MRVVLSLAHLALFFGLSTQTPVENTPAAQPRADQAASLRETTWNPPAYLETAIDAAWEQKTSKRTDPPLSYANWVFQQVIANNGKLNYCVRWQSRRVLTAEMRRAMEEELQRESKKWFDLLAGFEGWRYETVPVTIVGWAASDKRLVQAL